MSVDSIIHSTDSETFADYVSQQNARNTIQLNVHKWSLMLCDALRQDYINYSIKQCHRSIENLKYTYGEDSSSVQVDYYVDLIKKLENGQSDYDFIIESGRKYYKIIQVVDGGPNRLGPSRSVHAFIDKKTGEVYKAASVKSPAKGVRYNLNIINQREWLYEHADWAGSYLYKK